MEKSIFGSFLFGNPTRSQLQMNVLTNVSAYMSKPTSLTLTSVR